MSYTLVKGKFYLFYETTRHVGSQPDGDSVWFKPDNPNLFKNLVNRSAKFNKEGFTQLRFEAIDALELHFDAKHQRLDLSTEARDFTLKGLKFTKVEFSGASGLSVKNAKPHPAPGYILSRSIDPYGRPVSFVFVGQTDLTTNNNQVFLDINLLDKSVNAKIAKAGEAYPTFYTGLPTDLRNRIIALSDSAKNSSLGLWPKDVSSKASVTGLADLEKIAIWPKLFRRLVSYFKENNQALAGFDQWLRAKPADRDDEIWIVSKGELDNLHDVITVTNNTIGLKYSPKDMIISPR
jgi:endonuclease YncB( thermonuclease family)